MRSKLLKGLLGFSLLGFLLVFLASLVAEHPSRLERPEKSQSSPTEISVLAPPTPPKPPEPIEETSPSNDALADLAPQSLSSQTSVPGFGQGFGEGGDGPKGNGSLTQGSESLVKNNSSVDRAARVVQRTPPSYPQAARSKGISGLIVVKVKISSSGSVEEAKVESAEPPGIFEDAALSAVRSWRFEPAFQKGNAVASWLQQKIRFELN